MFNQFLNQIKLNLPSKQIIEDELLLYAYSTDASLYRMVPKLALIVKSESEVLYIINLAHKYDIKLTFRAAGTSLSGQAVTDQILVILSNDAWRSYQIINNGKQIKLEPGIIGADANRYLKAYKTQIGPDPGSINTAKIGGIIANNSSGMCCGTAKNSYTTIQNMRAILADGSIFDSSSIDSLNKFKTDNTHLLEQISAIRNKINLNNNLAKFIRKKFAIKNTSGYSLNAFLDFSDPIKILERLMIGSEGTLGFISNVTLNTVKSYEHKALNLIYGKLDKLIELTVKISGLNVSSVELLDYLSLESVKNDKSLQNYLIELPDSSYAAIMVEVIGLNNNELQDNITSINHIINNTNVLHQIGFSTDTETMATIWKARSGVLPTIAGQRPLGSSVIIEDVAVEINLLPQLIDDVRNLCIKYNFNNVAIFGHVLAGNIHFVITPNFANPEETLAYDKFMHELTSLIANKFNGSLKAEHGSGRNISPFAIVEWGEECWNIMWEIKYLLDPKVIFNPDVKLTKDYTLHMKHLKSFDSVDNEIDKCMECGFCEPVCPSRKLSLTPRQRNTVARKITTLSGDKKLEWLQKYQYYGVDTCATTSMCKTACPVGIDTGKFILSQKQRNNTLTNHTREIEKLRNKLQLANFSAGVIGRNNLQKITEVAHKKIKSIPIYLNNMPEIQSHNFTSVHKTSKSIYLIPACPNRIFSSSKKFNDYPSKLILEKIGYNVEYLSDIKNICCGQIYHSKCNHTQEQNVVNKLKNELSTPKTAIIDNSSCAGFANDSGIDIVDINQFIIAKIDKANLRKKYKKIALHIDCSTAKHSFNPKYIEVLQACCDELIIPEGIKCCGFAGDKGFSVPELNQSSLSGLASQISECEIGVTFNRSCQIGLTHHGKIEYISFVELILDCLI
ncbi:MAG: FAD-binding and (Fe-S)-binding domain-containing protein [Burkholderiales bacterium]|nr:FAD-binding and (Fe-S)-binding domain-containing protein [Burkholderiales bacterium]